MGFGMIRLVGAICLLATPVLAKPGTPGPAYFSGIYERVGRDAGGVLQNDLMQIAPAGNGVTLRACTGDAVAMSFGPAFEIVNLMTGAQGADAYDCLFHNNGYNRPILTCRSQAGAAFTLWPTTAKALICNS